MKKYYFLIIVALIFGLVLTGCSLLSNVGQVPASEQSGISGMVKSPGPYKIYGDVTLTYTWEQGNFSDIWDITKGDLTLSYTIDMSTIATAGWAVTEVGLREEGAPNLDPNLQGGWMQSNYINGTSNPNSLNDNDMHLLSKHGWLHQTYDAEDAETLITPYWSGVNYGFWFDRDGVDVWQAVMWGMDGIYDTGGIYEIVITYHSIDAITGTMFATINGVQQGLYIGGWKDAQPEFYPAGRSFEGDMTEMQVFYGRGEGGGTVMISDITVKQEIIWPECTVDLIAGQNEVAGTVTVDDDGENLLITYETNGDWEMTETHLYVGKTNPMEELTSAPGQFPYSAKHSPAATTYIYTIPIAEIDSYHLSKKGNKWIADGNLGVVTGDQIYIAAHAEVEKITEFAPRYPSGVFDFEQGKRKDSSSVLPERSVLENGLEYEPGQNVSNFFSLGFGGWIIVEFDCPIPNGEDNDLRIIEDTYSTSYPLETAEVYASQDGTEWLPLGTAYNAPCDGTNSFSTFDLLSLGWAKYIKVVDTTDPAVHKDNADGFNLNAVEALQDCVQEETAWGNGDPIRPDKNWAMYFEYPCPEPE